MNRVNGFQDKAIPPPAIVRGVAFCAVAAIAGLALAQDPPFNAALVGQWDGYDGLYAQVESDGQFAYLGSVNTLDGNPAQVQIVDLADLSNPTLATTYFVPAPNQSRATDDVTVSDGLLYIGLEDVGTDLVEIVDVRVPSSPVHLTTARAPGFTQCHNVYVDDRFLYIADDATPRVAVFDVRSLDPDNPPATDITAAYWVVDGIGASHVHDITVQNGRLYVAAWDGGLHVYDVSDIANTAPAFLGSVAGSSTHSVYATDDGSYVVTAEERPGGGLRVFEVTDQGGSLSFSQTDSYVLGSEAFSVHNPMMVGDRLYASWWQAGMLAFDLDTQTGTLDFVARYDTCPCDANGGGLGAFGVYPFLGDDAILVSDLDFGLFVVDLFPTGEAIFSDGFESGDTSEWSDSIP